jgi:hypothetical protein
MATGPEDPARTVFKFHGCRHSAAADGDQLEVCLCVAALGWAGSIKLGIGTSSWHGRSAGESGRGGLSRSESRWARELAANFET